MATNRISTALYTLGAGLALGAVVLRITHQLTASSFWLLFSLVLAVGIVARVLARLPQRP